MRYYTILYYTVLYYTMRYYTILYYTIPYYKGSFLYLCGASLGQTMKQEVASLNLQKAVSANYSCMNVLYMYYVSIV